MKYRVEADIAFNTEDDAVAFLNLLQEVKDKICTVDGNSRIAVISKARYHECTHDDPKPTPCKDYIHFDLKSQDKIDVKTKSGVKIAADSLLTK